MFLPCWNTTCSHIGHQYTRDTPSFKSSSMRAELRILKGTFCLQVMLVEDRCSEVHLKSTTQYYTVKMTTHWPPYMYSRGQITWKVSILKIMLKIIKNRRYCWSQKERGHQLLRTLPNWLIQPIENALLCSVFLKTSDMDESSPIYW